MRLTRKALLLSALLLSGYASAHTAPGGWEYDKECCSTTDCSQVPDATIHEIHGGYEIVLNPGDHPMLKVGHPTLRMFIPHGDPRIRVSGDEHKHACVSSSGAYVFCIYVPPGGV